MFPIIVKSWDCQKCGAWTNTSPDGRQCAFCKTLSWKIKKREMSVLDSLKALIREMNKDH